MAVDVVIIQISTTEPHPYVHAYVYGTGAAQVQRAFGGRAAPTGPVPNLTGSRAHGLTGERAPARSVDARSVTPDKWTPDRWTPDQWTKVTVERFGTLASRAYSAATASSSSLSLALAGSTRRS